jgi:hypothetical protein
MKYLHTFENRSQRCRPGTGYNSDETILQLSFATSVFGVGVKSIPKKYLPLSNNLKKLFCDYNKLSSLPQLPNSLEELHVTGNKLTFLPELPPNLKELWCSNNLLTSLPELPKGLNLLYCSSLLGDELPELPPNLKVLKCDLNYKYLPIKYLHMLNVYKEYKHVESFKKSIETYILKRTEKCPEEESDVPEMFLYILPHMGVDYGFFDTNVA